MLGIVCSAAAPSMAATNQGSVQLKYTVNAVASVSIATNYSAAGAQQLTAPTILPSAAGQCTAPASETGATLTFAGITPPAAGYTGCYYKNAVSVGVLSNDTLGVKIYEYLDVLNPGEQVCAFPTDAAPVAANPTASSASGNPAAYAAACAAGGTALAALGATNSGGAGFGGPGAPGGTVVNANPLYTTWTAGGFTLYSGTANSGTIWKYMGQDVQLNVNGTAPSTAQTNVISFAIIPN